MNQPATNQQRERTQKVFDAVKKAVNNSTSTPFQAGDISQALRDGGFPLGSWEVRGEFSALETVHMIELDAASAQWRLTATGASASKLG